MRTEITSTIHYRDTAAKINDTTLLRIEQIVKQYTPDALYYCNTIVPNSYNYRKNCQIASYSNSLDTLYITDGYAKSGCCGRGTHYTIYLSDNDSIELARANNWHCIKINRATNEHTFVF